MREYKEVEIKIERVNKVYCNMCGECIEADISGNINDYVHIAKKWGYNSDMDGEKHNIDLCQKCYKDMISKFKIKVN